MATTLEDFTISELTLDEVMQHAYLSSERKTAFVVDNINGRQIQYHEYSFPGGKELTKWHSSLSQFKENCAHIAKQEDLIAVSLSSPLYNVLQSYNLIHQPTPAEESGGD